MKQIIFAIALFPLAATAQQYHSVTLDTRPQMSTEKPRLSLPIDDRITMEQLNTFVAGLGLSFTSGFCYGVREVVQHHPNRIPEDWNQQWWDSRESWKNKYRNHEPKQGRTMTPVMFTDAYHLFGTMHRWTATGAGITIGINLNRRKNEGTPLKIRLAQAGADLLMNAAFFQAGFLLSYKTDALFNP